jgi:hypothetical protein
MGVEMVSLPRTKSSGADREGPSPQIHFREGPQKMLMRLQGVRPKASGRWEFHRGESLTEPVPFYRTVYADGTPCDLTGRRREIEVLPVMVVMMGMVGRG